MTFRTSYAAPWALIKRGGEQIGKRPFTRRAFITRAIAKNGHIVKFKGFMCDESWRPVTKERDIFERDIVKTWRKAPQRQTIDRTKKALKPVS